MMRSDDGFERFGVPGRFALDLRLLPDPDPETMAPASSTGSWGQWRLWVNGLNLAEHRLTVATGQTVRSDCVTWYLAPLLRWLAGNWTPLLHEERLPSLVRGARTGRDAYLAIAGTWMDDALVFTPWQVWAARHSLRWAAEGGLLPDVFLRRLGDDIEFSWGDRWQPGGEAADYVIEPGIAHCAVIDVAAALDRALAWAVREPALAAQSWHACFRDAAAARPGATAADTCVAWYLDRQEMPGRLTTLFHGAVAKVGGGARALLRQAVRSHALSPLSPAVAMFGALSPDISDTAAVELLAAATASRAGAEAPHPMDKYVRIAPAWRADRPWEDGYRLALDLTDDLDWNRQAVPVDLDALLDRLQVTRRETKLGPEGPLGVALAGPDLAPTILVNADRAVNRHVHGRRFTLAHELCHLLYDRDRARRVTHTSTPWAPVMVEQRANAFAAMLLMPHAAVRLAFNVKGRWVELADVQDLAQTLEVGVRAAIQHLANLGEITRDDRERLLDEAAPDSYAPTMKPH
jgi:Zn-dependent peptidase ImmA (M78 family)